MVVTPDFSNDATSFNNTVFGSYADRQAVVEWVSGGGSCPSGQLEISTGIRYSNGRIQRADQGFFFAVPFSAVQRSSAAFNTGKGRADLPDDLDAAANPIASRSLPSGNYVVSAKLFAYNDIDSPQYVFAGACELRAGGAVIDSQRFSLDRGSSINASETIALQGVATRATRAALHCSDRGDSAATAENVQLTAIQVPELTK